MWYILGKLHRIGGPAVTIRKYGKDIKMWCKDGLLSRDDGPAITIQDGEYTDLEVWFKDGKIHRDQAGNPVELPVVPIQNEETFDSNKQLLHFLQNEINYYLFDGESDKLGYLDDLFSLDTYVVPSKYFSDKCVPLFPKFEEIISNILDLSLDDRYAKFLSEKTTSDSSVDSLDESYYGGSRRRDIIQPAFIVRQSFRYEEKVNAWYLNGQLHNTEGPALRIKDDDKLYEEYRYLGKLHKEDGPACTIKYPSDDSFKKYCINGMIHKTDGPAIEFITSKITRKEWYINGKRHREDASTTQITLLKFLDQLSGFI